MTAERQQDISKKQGINPAFLYSFEKPKRLGDVFKEKGIVVEGFNPAQREWASGAIEAIGLPISRKQVARVEYSINSKESEDWLGSMNYKDNTLVLYERLGDTDMDPLSTLSHEQIHALSCFNNDNDDLYGGRKNREQAMEHVYAVAGQTYATKVTLNDYHECLLKDFETGEISFGRFLRETEAIMSQLRLNSPDILQEKQGKQLEKLQEMGMGESYISLTAEPKSTKLVGVDRSLAQLMNYKARKEMRFSVIRNNQDLDEVVARIGKYKEENGNPFKKVAQ